jgi:large subunit ribosomal protein L19
MSVFGVGASNAVPSAEGPTANLPAAVPPYARTPLMSELIQSIERRQLREGLPSMRMGDRVRVHFQVVEGNRRRTQVFEGVVIRLQGPGSRRTFTVRKLSFGVGVERTFPLHSPKIERLEVVARGEVRRAKLYYLRGRIGRRARLRERRDFTPELASAGIAPGDAEAPAEEQVVDEAGADEPAAEETAAEEPAAEEESAAEEEPAVEEAAAEPEAGEREAAAEQDHPADDKEEG